MLSLQLLCLSLFSVVSLATEVVPTPMPLKLTRNENAAQQVIATAILKEIYHKAGMSFTMQPLPSARANVMALKGEMDGEVARIAEYSRRNPTLIKVEPSYYSLTTTAFAKKDSKIKIHERVDLQKYRIAVVRGIVHAQIITQGLPNVVVVSDYEQMFDMLNLNRIDIAIDTFVNGTQNIEKMHLTNIVPIASLAHQELYHILHNSKRNEAKKISAAISDLIKKGELKKIIKKYETQFAEKKLID